MESREAVILKEAHELREQNELLEFRIIELEEGCDKVRISFNCINFSSIFSFCYCCISIKCTLTKIMFIRCTLLKRTENASHMLHSMQCSSSQTCCTTVKCTRSASSFFFRFFFLLLFWFPLEIIQLGKKKNSRIRYVGVEIRLLEAFLSYRCIVWPMDSYSLFISKKKMLGQFFWTFLFAF